MATRNLKPIPIPFRQRWREFRVAYLPVITFASLVVMIGWMWTRYVQPAAIIGEVETVRANIISVVAGTLSELKVDRLQAVTNGQELAVITVVDPDQLKVELLAAEADLRLMKARMDLDKTRNLDSYSRLKEESLVEGLNLQLARIRLQQAEEEFARTKKLFDQQLIAQGAGSAPSGYGLRNDFGYDVALRDRDALRAEVVTREKTVSELQTGVQRLQAAGAAQLDPADAAVEQAINAQRERLQRIQRPIVLRSPINGFVNMINHLPGEKISAGEPLLVLGGEKSSRIIAWIRQPVTARPRVGDVLKVHRLTPGQQAFEATVVRVGKQLEQISATAVSLSEGSTRAEFGLPVLAEISGSLDLLPGEPLRLQIVKHAAGAEAN